MSLLDRLRNKNSKEASKNDEKIIDSEIEDTEGLVCEGSENSELDLNVVYKESDVSLMNLEVDLITSKSKNVTKRDLEILRFIAKFGYVYIEHIEKAFNLNKVSRRAYQLIGKLKQLRLIAGQRVLYRAPELLYLTKRGNEMIGTKPARKIALATLDHDLNIIYFYLALRDRYVNHDIMTDRELLKDNYKIGDTGHRPDLLIIGDNDYIAVEIELSRKTANRLKKIKNYYLDNHEYTKVLYLCNGNTYNYIKKFYEGTKMFEVVRINKNEQ